MTKAKVSALSLRDFHQLRLRYTDVFCWLCCFTSMCVRVSSKAARGWNLVLQTDLADQLLPLIKRLGVRKQGPR